MLRILHFLTPSLTWKIPANDNVLYLTFDDGPIPVVTPWVLECLKDYDAFATFFCVGENVQKHPDVFKKVIDAGHSIGNHTMSHVNGWQSADDKYFSEIAACNKLVHSKLFRPPYGRIKFSQVRHLKKEFRIIMWNVLSRDYDINLSGEKCFENVKNNAGKGSIIVFHDSLKAEERLRFALPATLKYFSELGFSFKAIIF